MVSASGTAHPSPTDDYELREILSEQRNELALDTDYDFAYSIQFQEALTASLSSMPSSSKKLEPIPQSDDVSEFIKLMSDEINRLEQEYADRDMCKSEARKMRDDLTRRIHDQKVASEILNLPEDWWVKYGDNFEKPYSISNRSAMCGGGGADALGNEEFRVYVKGLVSDERVRDEVVRVSGIGVAICDFRDNVIFEISKHEGVTRSAERVGLEALIEGMRAAGDFGLKKISFFTDEYLVHQYVTGKQLSREHELTLLCNKALSLQTNFKHLSLSHVTRNGLKFAFKLARDAIVSQITWRTETKRGKKLIETCVICLEDIPIDKMFSIDGCLHRYCFSCMKQHMEVKLLNGMLADCPHEGCKSNVIIEKCRSFLEPKFVDIMNQKIKEASIPVTEKVYCPYPRCSALMSKKEALEYAGRNLYAGAAQIGMRKCSKCFGLFCINCMVPWHYNMSCDDNRKIRPEDVKLKCLASKKKWRQCVKCNHMIELLEGCYHISCRHHDLAVGIPLLRFWLFSKVDTCSSIIESSLKRIACMK